MFLDYAANKNFKVYEMDVKSTFLNGELEEEVYIEQLEGIPLTKEKDMVCRLNKALYGLKQAPRTWYVRLDKHLAKPRFAKSMTENNLCLKETKNGLLIIIVFVDDIIFGGNDEASDEFSKEMKNEFEMSMRGEMNFFLGLQIVQNSERIFILQTKYLKDLLKGLVWKFVSLLEHLW